MIRNIHQHYVEINCKHWKSKISQKEEFPSTISDLSPIELLWDEWHRAVRTDMLVNQNDFGNELQNE